MNPAVEEINGTKWNGVKPIVIDAEDLDQLIALTIDLGGLSSSKSKSHNGF